MWVKNRGNNVFYKKQTVQTVMSSLSQNSEGEDKMKKVCPVCGGLIISHNYYYVCKECGLVDSSKFISADPFFNQSSNQDGSWSLKGSLPYLTGVRNTLNTFSKGKLDFKSREEGLFDNMNIHNKHLKLPPTVYETAANLYLRISKQKTRSSKELCMVSCHLAAILFNGINIYLDNFISYYHSLYPSITQTKVSRFISLNNLVEYVSVTEKIKKHLYRMVENLMREELVFKQNRLWMMPQIFKISKLIESSQITGTPKNNAFCVIYWIIRYLEKKYGHKLIKREKLFRILGMDNVINPARFYPDFRKRMISVYRDGKN